MFGSGANRTYKKCTDTRNPIIEEEEVAKRSPNSRTRRAGASNTDTALTMSPKEATMARQQRSTAFVQESTRPIAQVALYARVSTLNNQDPEMQLAELREYAGRRGWQIVEEFTDQGVSGCKESRPALDVPDHRRDGGVRASLDPGAGPSRATECTRQGQTTGQTAGDRGCFSDRLSSLTGTLLGADHRRDRS